MPLETLTAETTNPGMPEGDAETLDNPVYLAGIIRSRQFKFIRDILFVSHYFIPPTVSQFPV